MRISGGQVDAPGTGHTRRSRGDWLLLVLVTLTRLCLIGGYNLLERRRLEGHLAALEEQLTPSDRMLHHVCEQLDVAELRGDEPAIASLSEDLLRIGQERAQIEFMLERRQVGPLWSKAISVIGDLF